MSNTPVLQHVDVGYTGAVGRFLLTALIIIAVFDPSDMILGLKLPVFLSIWAWYLVAIVSGARPARIHRDSFMIVMVFACILPLLSISIYLLQGADLEVYEGFQSLKGYLFLSLLLVLVGLFRTDLLRYFVQVLNLQAICILIIFGLLIIKPELREPLTHFGWDRGFLWINDRTYGGATFSSIFFKTSPFLVFSIAHYTQAVLVSHKEKGLAAALLLLTTNVAAMILSGTRMNMLFAVLTPAIVFYSYSRYKLLIVALYVGAALCVIALSADVLIAMIDPREFSNAVKIGYLRDYAELFSHWPTLLFGQGIGAHHYFMSLRADLSLTEVTGLEVIRNFGVILGISYILLFLYPLLILSSPRHRGYRSAGIAYGIYLVISLSNAFIMSSTGMLLLSIMLYLLYNPHAACVTTIPLTANADCAVPDTTRAPA